MVMAIHMCVWYLPVHQDWVDITLSTDYEKTLPPLAKPWNPLI